MNKRTVTDALNALRKLGFKVFHMNDRRATPAGMRDFTDHIIFGKRSVTVIEDKLSPSDRLTDGQKEFIAHVTRMECLNIIVLVNYGDDIPTQIDSILKADGRI